MTIKLYYIYSEEALQKMLLHEKLPQNPSDATPVGVEVSVPGKKK